MHMILHKYNKLFLHLVEIVILNGFTDSKKF